MSTYLPDPNTPPNGYGNCPDFLAFYLDYLEVNLNRRPNTQVNCLQNLRDFCQFIRYKTVMHEIPPTAISHKDMDIFDMSVKELAAVSHEDIASYVYFLSEVVGNSTATVCQKICSIHRLYIYLTKMQTELGIFFPAGDPTAYIVRPSGKAEPDSEPVLTVAELERLLTGAAGETAIRDRALILLLCTTGITLSETVSINREDVDKKLWLRVCGKAPRFVYLTPPCRSALQLYIDSLRVQEDCEPVSIPLFCSSESHFRRLTTRMVRYAVCNAGARAGLGVKVTPRLIRQSVKEIVFDCSEDVGIVNIVDYFGYKLTPALRKRLANSPPKYNKLAQQIIDKSPLGTLGATKGGD